VSNTASPGTTADQVLDPDVRRFVSEVNAAYARIPGFDSLSPPEARRAAEVVRAPWRQGGPAMTSVRERFVPVTGGTMRIRVYDPGPAGAKPALIYAHGGGWTLFSVDTHDRVMREYAARAGIVVVGVDYPLAPEVKFPVALTQITDVIRWLGDHGPELGIRPQQLAIGGDSAGANLSMSVALMLRDAGEPLRLAALLLNYGAFEVDCSAASVAAFGGEGFMLNAAEIKRFWANYLRTAADAANPLACPALARLEGLPPVFLTIPECDILSEQSFAMIGRFRAAGVSVHSKCYAGATHSFLEAVSISALAAQALDDGSAWLNDVLRLPQPAEH
jgi:acetyl esterase